MSKIEIYQAKNGQTTIDVKFEKDTIWLNQKQIGELFSKERSVVTKHIKNIFNEGELDLESNVQNLHIPNSDKPVIFYNLDVIISVGYRVKSIEGTQFRQWATQRLKEHLVNGYTINQKRLEQLQKTIEIIQNTGSFEDLQLDEAKGLLEIINKYTQSFILLNQFDSNNLLDSGLNDTIVYEIDSEEASKAISKLKQHLISKREATELFGNQKDESFKGILGKILQSFDNQIFISNN